MLDRREIAISSIACAAAALTLCAAPASAKYSTVVVPGKSIAGISLGQTKKKIHAFRPLGLKRPTSSTLTAIPGYGTLRSETYTTPAGVSLVVAYGKRKHKPPTVVLVTTGLGYWATAGGILAGAVPGQQSGGATPTAVAQQFPCSFYQKDAAGNRLYSPDPGDGQYCELIYDQQTYFYFTFNPGGISADIPAVLASFSLSRFYIQ